MKSHDTLDSVGRIITYAITRECIDNIAQQWYMIAPKVLRKA
jgi:hypothetical protein